jgi:pimeloyl-ACP methyl ester carboxylesterase
MDAPETHYARSGDVWIAYRVFGDGPFDVVYHPGFISHVELMTELPTSHGRVVERLASFSRLIVLDQRGVGMSDRVSDAPGLEVRMDDLRAVMDAAGSSRAAILSVSIGVPLSVLFAATYPERTSALVLARGFARELWAPDYPWGWTIERQRSVVEALQKLFFGPRGGITTEALGEVVMAGFSNQDLEYLRRAAASPGTIKTLAEMNREADVRHVLPAVRVPTLLAHLVDDPTFPIGGARYMAEQIPGARLIELPGKSLHRDSGLERMLDEAEKFLLGCGRQAAGKSPNPIGCLRQCCSPTSSARASTRADSETGPGGSCSSAITSSSVSS